MIFFESDPDHLMVIWRFISGFGLCLGIIVFFIMRFPQYRRQQFSHGPGCGTVMSLIVSLGIVALFAGIGWRLMANSYVEARLDSSALSLRYILPSRMETIDYADISRINLQYVERRKYRVVVRTHRGQMFKSRPKNIHHLRSEFEQFKQSIRTHGASFTE